MQSPSEPTWKLRRSARLAELKAGQDRDAHPLESGATIRRIEAAEDRERILAAMAQSPRRADRVVAVILTIAAENGARP